MRSKILLGIFTVIVQCLPGVTFAADVTIQDTGGFTRAVSEVDQSGQVEFSLVNGSGAASDGIPVSLTNTATGQVLSGTSVNGVVSFQGVTPGVWTVASTTPGVTFTGVTIAGAAAAGAGAVTLGTAATVVAIGGAGTAVAVGVSNSGSSSGSELSPST